MKRNWLWFVIATLVMSSLLLVACDESVTDYHTHRYGAWEFTTTPTATTDGSAKRSCECGDEQSVTVAKLSDTSVWTVSSSQDATHETNGYALYTSEYGTVTTTSAKGEHTYGDWTITTEPTMDAAGSAIKICECGHSVEEEVPALNNNIWTKDESNKPSHDVAGSVIYSSDYGKVTIYVPAGSHSFGNWTDNGDGTHTRSCDCGVTENAAHVFDQRVANSAARISDATCTNGAKYHYSCVCGAISNSNNDSDVFYSGEGTGHVFSEFTLTKAPTCTETGTASVKCKNCNYVNTNSVIAALGHTWDEAWHPYYANSKYQDSDTGEVEVSESKTSEYHAHACTVCGALNETDKVAHTYGETYVTASKSNGYTQMATEHACACGYTESVNENLGYFEFENSWKFKDRKEPTYNEQGYEKRTHSSGLEYTLVLPKLVAPYDGKTYYSVELSLNNELTIGAASVYSRSESYVTIDENGKGTGVGYPFRGEHTVTMVDASTGKITWTVKEVTDDEVKTTTYNGYVDMTTGIVVFGNNPLSKDVFVGSWFEKGALSAKAFAGSVWDSNMAISYKHTCSIGEHEFNIYIDGSNNVTFGVEFVDANGVSVAAGDIHNANYVKVLKNGVKLGAFAKDVDGELVATDGYEGTYEADLGNGSETVILDGTGRFTAGAKSGTYTLVSDAAYTADMYVVESGKNVEYYRITLADGNMTATKPMITITYVVGEHGSAIDSAQANVNIEFTPETPTATSTTYAFAGWYLDEDFNDPAGKVITPISDTNITLYACWKTPVQITVSDEHGSAIDTSAPWGSLLNDYLPDYTADETVKDGYIFKGWYINDEDGDMVDSTTTATENVTIIAAWEWGGNITFEKQTGYTFVYDTVNGYWKSNNQGINNSTATIEFKVSSGKAVVSFDYYCESESDSKWDYMTIYYGPDWKSVTAGGKACDWSWKTITTTLDSSIDNGNQRIRITYQKDGSGVYDSDTAYICNLKVNGIPVAAQQPLNKDIAGTYTCGDTTVKVGAGGLATIGDNESSYTVISDVDNVIVIGVELSDGYREITLNKEAGTCTIVTPQVNVTYNYGGHGDNATTSVDKMSTQDLSTDVPTADGFIFRGWYTDDKFTTKASATFVADSDVTFYAKWDEAVTITYVYNDGNAHANETDSTYYANDEVTSLKEVDFTYGTKVFVAWFTKDGSSDGDWGDAYAVNTVITDDITLYAKWVEPSPFMGTYTMLRFYNDETGARNVWNSNTQKLVIDALGKGTVGAWNGFTYSYEVTIEFAEDSSSVVVIKAGSPTSTSKTTNYGVYDAASGVIVRADSEAGFGYTVYMMVPYHSDYATTDFEMFAWSQSGVYRKFISFADKNTEESTIRTIFIENATNVVFGVDSWNAKKADHTNVESLENVKTDAIMFSVTAGSMTYYYAKNSSGSFVIASDTDIQGKYVNGEDYIVINGAGVIYFKDGSTGTYTKGTDGTTISALTSTANYVITLNTENNTFTKADNTVTITYSNDKIDVESDDFYVGIWRDLKTPDSVDGFVFRGWYPKDGTNNDWGTKVTGVRPTENVTYYAKYDAAVTITYDYNGYTDADGNAFSTVNTKYVNDTVGTLSTDLKDAEFGDKVFVGWFTKDGTDDDWGTEVTTSTTLTDNVTYYAKWIVPHVMTGSYKGYNVYNSSNAYAQNAMTITVLGKITSGAKTGTITDYNAETGYFTLVNGSSKYYSYYDSVNGIAVISYSSNTTSFGTYAYYYFKDATSLSVTSSNIVSWNGNKSRLIPFVVDGVAKIIYINDTEVYCNVDVVDTTGSSVTISSALKTADTVITIKKGTETIATYGYVGDTFVLSDGMNGTYTATEDKGLGSIVLDGYGSVTIGETTVSYDLDGTKITFVHANRMYVLTLDTAGTYTHVQDGYQGTYTMPDGSTAVTLDGYGAIDGTTQTYVISGTTVTVYDGETSTNYGIDTTDKKLLGKSKFAGLTFSGNYYDDWDERQTKIEFIFDDSSTLSGTLQSHDGNHAAKFTATFDGTTLVMTITEKVAGGGGDWENKTLKATLSGNTFTITEWHKTSGTYTFANQGTLTCPDYEA